MLVTKEIRIAKVKFFNYKEAQKYVPQFKHKVIKSKKYQQYVESILNEYLNDIERILERTGFKIKEIEYEKDGTKIYVLMKAYYKPTQIFKSLKELSGKVFANLIEKLEDLYIAADVYKAEKITINEDEIETFPFYSFDKLYQYFADKITDIINEIQNILQKVLDELLSDEWIATWVVDNKIEVEIETELNPEYYVIHTTYKNNTECLINSRIFKTEEEAKTFADDWVKTAQDKGYKVEADGPEFAILRREDEFLSIKLEKLSFAKEECK